MYRNRLMLMTALLVATVASLRVQAENVDLSTVPPRDTVQLTIYNSEDLTLVRETRTISIKKGVNPLQFSWANTLIDPSSVQLTFRGRADELDILDTTYPQDKKQMLYWNVKSEFTGDVHVEISYFTSGISWQADYVCIADADDQNLSFEGYVKITNHSGEDYADAQVRMVVGTINLVEKIADLARKGMIEVPEGTDLFTVGGAKPESEMVRAQRGRALKMALADAKPKQIVKEGLSEYFIYTVPGTETVKNGWSKRMRLFAGGRVPYRIQYRYRPQEYGNALNRVFLLRNNQKSHLGETPLPDGRLLFMKDIGQDRLTYVHEQTIDYVPIGQEIEIPTGQDPQVIYKLVPTKTARENFWFKRKNVDIYYSPEKGHEIRIDDQVVGWDERTRFVERIRNYRDEPIHVEIRRPHYGHVIFRSNLDPILHDFRTPQYSATIQPGEKRELIYEIVRKMGRNHKQENVTLESLGK